MTTSELFWEMYRSKTKEKKLVLLFILSICCWMFTEWEKFGSESQAVWARLEILKWNSWIYRRIEFKIIIFISRIQVWHLKTVKYNSVSICYVGRAIHDFYWLKCPFPLPTVTELVWVRECIQLPGCLELILIY